MSKEILGHIDCPHCGWESGMRITLDKSGAPFGYCEANCNGQMRVGGNAARVRAFYAKHPHIKQPGEAPAAPAAPEAPAAQAPKKIEKPAAPAAVEKVATPKKAPPRPMSFFEQLAGAKQ